MRLEFKKHCHQMCLCFHYLYRLFHKIVFKREQEVFTLLPTIVFDHVSKLNDKFSFLVFLTALKGVFLEKRETRFQDRIGFVFQLHFTLCKENNCSITSPQTPLAPCGPGRGRGGYLGDQPSGAGQVWPGLAE